MFQFSSLLTRSDAESSRRRLSASSPSPISPSVQSNDEDSLTNPAGQCVSDRVRRDLDEQMQRLADLLDRVESIEFERETETADIFSLGRNDLPEETAVQPQIFSGTKSTQWDLNNGSSAQDATAESGRDSEPTRNATGDDLLRTSVVLPPTVPLSFDEIDSLAGLAVICNSPGSVLLDSEPCTEPVGNESPAAPEMDTEIKSSVIRPRRSLRSALATESTTTDDSVSLSMSEFNRSQALNILAAVVGLLTLAVLAYVAADLASWFEPLR